MLQVGFGVGDITPEVDMEMPGHFIKREGKGVFDRLLVVACVIRDGENTIALVGIDALVITRQTVNAARRLIRKQTKIPGSNVLIGANHTHSGGPIASCFQSVENPKYSQKVAQVIADAVTHGWKSLHDFEIGVATGTVPRISFNRRFFMCDGREITQPQSPHHQEIVKPAGPIDPKVGVLAVRTLGKNGEIVGVVVHFACHSTVLIGENQFSPDYTAYLRKHLKEHFGERIPIVFLLGPCGDIAHMDCRNSAWPLGHGHADMMGSKLALEAIRVIGKMRWRKDAPLEVRIETVQIPIRDEPDPVKERPPYGLGSDQDTLFENERKLVARERRRRPILPSEAQAIRIGPLGILAIGAELFCEYGLRIKKASTHQTTWVVTLANDWIGYVPTGEAFFAGGYEPRTARSSKLAPDSGQRLVEAALKALSHVTAK